MSNQVLLFFKAIDALAVSDGSEDRNLRDLFEATILPALNEDGSFSWDSEFEPYVWENPLAAGTSISHEFSARPKVPTESEYLVVRGTVPDGSSVWLERLRDSVPYFSHLENDVEIEPCVCTESTTLRKVWGTHDDVLANSEPLHAKGLNGEGVYICLIDTGIGQGHLEKNFPKFLGTTWRERFTESGPGESARNLADALLKNAKVQSKYPEPYRPAFEEFSHGTMMAFDCALLAPSAKIVDLPLLQPGPITKAWLSDVGSVLSALKVLIGKDPWKGRRIVINNSWHLADRNEPVQGDYDDPNYSFNLTIGSLAQDVDILFAAGNCGRPCHKNGWKSPHRTIHGANSHPDVLSVAAANVYGCYLTLSSQGPGRLGQTDPDKQKPDIMFFSHFVGSGVNPSNLPTGNVSDGGTSAACAVASGLVASLRSDSSALRSKKPSELANDIRENSDRYTNGHSTKYGFGIPNLKSLADLAKP